MIGPPPFVIPPATDLTEFPIDGDLLLGDDDYGTPQQHRNPAFK